MITRDQILDWIRRYADAISDHKDTLTSLDAAIGDADHGSNMQRGFQMVLGKLSTVEDQDIGTIFKLVGMTLISSVGGASGPLYGTLFMQMATTTGGKLELTPDDLLTALEAGVAGVAMRGKANKGDKTMLDTLAPAIDAAQTALASGYPLPEMLTELVRAGEEGMSSTIPLVAHKGRASYLGERSAGHQDPGATSSYLMLKAAAETFSNQSTS